MPEITINGADKLIGKLGRNIAKTALKQVVSTNGSELQHKMTRNAVFTRGYSTGQTRRSITSDISDGGMTVTVKPTTEYSPYVEYGTRFMSAQPFVGPAFNVQKLFFKNDIERLMR